MLCKIKLDNNELILDIKTEEIRNIEKGNGLIDYLSINNYSADETLTILLASHIYSQTNESISEKIFDYSE